MSSRANRKVGYRKNGGGDCYDKDNERLFSPPSSVMNIDLKKEYCRFCKLYSSEPLDIVATPLERASYEKDSIRVDLKGRGLRGVDCIALGKIFALETPISYLNLSDCLLMPQGFEALMDGICKNSKLKILELRGNNISSNMVVALGKLLRQNSTLSHLLLEWNCLGASRECFRVFSEGLAVNTGLEILDLRNNQIDADCCLDLAAGLKHNKTLQEIDLRWNSIGLIGAKAIWSALRSNLMLHKISLCGNFIPEDIVNYIEQCLSERKEKDAIIENTNKITSILSQKLLKKEIEYENELRSMVSIFTEEETGLRLAIQRGQKDIKELEVCIMEKTNQNEALVEQVNMLKVSLKEALEREETFRQGMHLKRIETEGTKDSLKLEINAVRQAYETKVGMLNDEVQMKMNELQVMMTHAKDLEIQLSDKTLMIEHFNDLIDKMKHNSIKSESFFEERIHAEKEKWANWKSEVETAERAEIVMLEKQIKEIHQSMMDHIRVVETGKNEAEEEIRKLKLNLITIRAEAEENLLKLRKSLKEENDALVEGYVTKIKTLKDNNEKLEAELRKHENQLRKLEGDNDSNTREIENLRSHNSTMIQELCEKDTANQSALIRAHNEAKERVEQLKKEQKINEALRMEILDMQEQLATLTIKHSREIQEKLAEVQRWKVQIERKDSELARLKEDDVKRAALLQDAFMSYMQSTAQATGIPLAPLSNSEESFKAILPYESGQSPNEEQDPRISKES